MSATDPSPARPPPSRRILLVDDDPEFIALMKDHLVQKRDPTWIVHTAVNYSEALDCLKLNPVDLVVLDIQMPVMDGLQLLTLLKRTRPALPVVVLSGVVTQENRDYALQHGAALILQKTELATGIDTIYPALEATAEAPVEGFKGMLRQVGLIDLLQLECLGRKSSVMEIKGSNADGRIYISDGSIIHAEFDCLFGEKALARLLRLKGGEFRLAPFTQPGRQTIDGHWEALLMEAAQSSDEQEGEAPAVQAGGEAAGAGLESQAAAAQQERPDRRIEEIIVSPAANDILYQWKAPEAERRARLLNLLLMKSAGVCKMLPALGRADRFEIIEPRSRAICLLQPDRKIFVRLSILAPAD
jgi:CheY-like chemotaxis protein